MSSRREQGLVALKAALEVASVAGTTKPSGLTVHRSPHRPFFTDELPAQVIYQDPDGQAERIAYDATQRAHRIVTVIVETRISATGSVPDTALDPYLIWAEKALLADITLGGISSDIRALGHRVSWEEKDFLAAAAWQRFEVDILTQWDDPEAV